MSGSTRRSAVRRRAAAMVSTLGLAVSVGACGGLASGSDLDCSPYTAYGTDHGGAKVKISSSIRNLEAQRFINALSDFEKCTKIDIIWNGTGSFETDLQKDIKAGSAPDLAALPQPGLLKNLVAQGAAQPASDAVRAAAAKNYPPIWNGYGTVNDQYYATPLGANVKSLVWYSPHAFQTNNWDVPKTWDDLMKLNDQIVETDANVKPWCAGIESGTATGWPATDWVEDVLLRTQPPEVYDKWVSHEIPFNDRRIVDAIDETGKILRNPKYVNGGFGDVASIAVTAFQDGGLPIVDSGECAMYKQGNFLSNEWPSSVEIGQNGDVYAFVLPGNGPGPAPVLVAGEFLAAFNKRPETQAVQLYMSSPQFTNKKAKLGEWISANKGLDRANVANPVDSKLSLSLLQAPVIRFDGSDMMPGDVGAGSFWKEMTEWIAKGKSTQAVADAIEASWPK